MVGDVFISKGALTYKQVQCHLQGGGGVGAVKTVILKYPNSLLACFSSFFLTINISRIHCGESRKQN